MEYHIVYREGPELWGTGRQHQQVDLDRIAVFSTYEEARLYIQMVAIIDWNTYGRGKNGLIRFESTLASCLGLVVVASEQESLRKRDVGAPLGAPKRRDLASAFGPKGQRSLQPWATPRVNCKLLFSP